MRNITIKSILFNSKSILIAIMLFHLINNLFWHKNNGYLSPGCNSVWLEDKSFEYSDILLNDKMSILERISKTSDFFRLDFYDNTFSATNFNLTSFLTAFPLAASLGGHIKLFLINTILSLQFLLLLFAIYYLGKIIFNRTAGAWGAVIFSFYPGIIGLSRKMNSELLSTFFIVLSVIVFMQWRKLPLKALLLFTVFCLGVFSGALFLVFFIPLFFLHVFFTFFYREKKLENLREFIIFLFLIIVFFNFYFNGKYLEVFLNLKEGFDSAYKNLFFHSSNWIGSAAQGISELFLFAPQDAICPCTQTMNVGLNINTFLFYIMEMAYYVSPFFFLLAVFSFPIFFMNEKIDFYKKMLLGVWAVLGYLLLSLFDIKWGKFITPILPVFALVSGIFICDDYKKIIAKKQIVLILGILTIIHYSYFSLGHRHFLEKLQENIISHRPAKSRSIEIAEKIAAKIDNISANEPSKTINVVFLDKESLRFNGKDWVTDTSLRVDHLIRIFLKHRYRAQNFWKLSDDFYRALDKGEFIVLITKKKLSEVKDYLEVKEKNQELGLSIVYDDSLKKEVFIYLAKIN